MLKIICLGIFSVRRFFGENFQAPQNKDLPSFVTVPFSCYDDNYDCDKLPVLRREKQTCGHTILRYQEKRQVNTRVKGISHI